MIARASTARVYVIGLGAFDRPHFCFCPYARMHWSIEACLYEKYDQNQQSAAPEAEDATRGSSRERALYYADA